MTAGSSPAEPAPRSNACTATSTVARLHLMRYGLERQRSEPFVRPLPPLIRHATASMAASAAAASPPCASNASRRLDVRCNVRCGWCAALRHLPWRKRDADASSPRGARPSGRSEAVSPGDGHPVAAPPMSPPARASRAEVQPRPEDAARPGAVHSASRAPLQACVRRPLAVSGSFRW